MEMLLGVGIAVLILLVIAQAIRMNGLKRQLASTTEHLAVELSEQTREIEARVKHHEALFAIQQSVQSMRGPNDLGEVLRVFIEQIRQLDIQADAVAIHRIVEPEQREVETYRFGPEEHIDGPERRQSTALTDSWKAQQLLHRYDIEAQDPERDVKAMRERLGFDIRSYIDLPFSAGLLSAHSQKADAFSDRDIRVLGEIVEIVATGFARLEDFQRLENQNRALTESEDRFRTLAEATYEGIALYKGGVIFDASEQFLTMFGYTLDELKGRNILELIVPEHREYADNQYESGVETPYEVDMVRKDGSQFSVEIHGRFTTSGGERIRVASFRDLTERKEIEAERIHTQRLRVAGELSAGMSHNLNNILTGVLGPADYLRSRLDDPEILHDVNMIYESAQKARKLVERLHRAVRQQSRTLEAVDINAVVTEAVQTSRLRWKDEAEVRGVVIEVKTHLLAKRSICGNRAETYDVVLNLLFNAIDALPDGGEIRLETRDRNGEVVLSVSDTGIGMDEETRSRVFEPFFTTKMDVGTGLGLATVYGTVNAWGGQIDVTSTVGKGTAFYVTLPVWHEKNDNL